MSEISRVKVGVIGVGKMGLHHLQKYQEISEASLIGFFDRNSDRSSEMQQKFGARSYSSITELLFDVDAVSIASPTASHGFLVRQALDAGVHVLVEKPVTGNEAEADALASLAKERKLILQVGFLERFRFRALSREFSLSPVRYAEFHRMNPSPGRESDVDVVTDLMIHDLDLALSVTQEEPLHISAIGAPVLTSKTDIANVRLEFPSRAVINLTASRISASPHRKCQIFSPHAFASFDLISNSREVYLRRANGEIEKQTAPPFTIDPLREQCTHFLRCASGLEQPLITAEDGVRALKLARLVRDRIEQRAIWQIPGETSQEIHV